MQRALYSPRSERSARLIAQLELVFEDLDADATEAERRAALAAAKTTTVAAFTRVRPPHRDFPAHLPRERVVIAAPSYRIGGAKFTVLKDLDTFVFAGTPIDESRVRELATCSFLDGRRNAIFIGGTGTDKTHLCIAVAAAVIRAHADRAHFEIATSRHWSAN